MEECRPIKGFKYYKCIKKLGSGSFADTFLVIDIKDNKKYALKYIKKGLKEDIKSEVDILKRIKDKCTKYLICIKRVFRTKKKRHVIVMDYIPKSMDLKTFMKKNKLTKKQLDRIIQELIEGLKLLHRNGIVHMDIKLNNVLIYPTKDGMYSIKYIDYGLSCYKKDFECFTSYRGTKNYMSPEMLSMDIFNFDEAKQSDIWSLGILIYRLINRKTPWKNKRGRSLETEIKNTKDIKMEGKYKNIVENMLKRESGKRKL
jgi:serine/threonine protein kinase